MKKFFFLQAKTEKAQSFILGVVSGFVGMIIALAWNNILVTFIDLVGKKFPILSLCGGVVGAVLVTVFSIWLGMICFCQINSDTKDTK